jgi:hypothetical protein
MSLSNVKGTQDGEGLMRKFEAQTPKLETNTMKAPNLKLEVEQIQNPHKIHNRFGVLAFSSLRFIWLMFVSDFVLRISNLFPRLFRIRNSKFIITKQANLG